MNFHDITNAKHAVGALNEASQHDGAKGALTGAVAVAGTTMVALGTVGLSLTPPGLAVVAISGAVLGGTGLLKKIRQKLI